MSARCPKCGLEPGECSCSKPKPEKPGGLFPKVARLGEDVLTVAMWATTFLWMIAVFDEIIL